MCKSFEKLANEYADKRETQATIKHIKLMMKNMKCSLDEALNTLEIKGKECTIIALQFRK